MQRTVDVLGLSEEGPSNARLAHSLRACQVDQVQLSLPDGVRSRLPAAGVDGEDAVRAGGGHVHGRLGEGGREGGRDVQTITSVSSSHLCNHPVGVPKKQPVQS